MIFGRKKSASEKPTRASLFTGVPRGVPGGPPGVPAHETFPSEEALAGMPRFQYDPENAQGKIPLGVVGAHMKPIHLPGGRTIHAATGGTLLGVRDDRHQFLCCGNRAGKSRSRLLPLLILERENSILSLDPKGDFARETALFRSEFETVVLLDGFETAGPPCAQLRTSYNPLNLENPNDISELVETAIQVADAIVIPSSRHDTHWDDTAKHFLEGVIMFVITDDSIKGPRDLIEVQHQILTITNESFDPDTGETEQPLLQEQMLESSAANGAITAAASEFFGKVDRERSSTLSSLRKHLHFLSYPGMQHVLRDSKFRISDLVQSRMSVYACLPATKLSSCAAFPRILLNQLLGALEKNKDRQAHQHQTGGHRVIAILDEFASLGRVKILEDMAGQVAGLGCTLFPVLQDLSQGSVYGEKFQTFIGNASTLNFYGNSDTKTLAWIERRLGTTTVHTVSKNNPSLKSAIEGNQGTTFSQSNHPLLTMSEIARLFDRDDPLARQLVFLPTVGPVIMQRFLYDQHEVFQPYRDWMKANVPNT